MTTRDRRIARAERLEDWAGKREAKATADLEQARAMADLIPFGQPVLAGHHSQGRDERYRGRIHLTIDRGMGNAAKAREMASKAANIKAATDASIFDDDPDACEVLEARIALVEAERDRIKAYNASCRRGSPDPSVLDDKQRSDLTAVTRYSHLGKGGQFPAYHLSNLGGRLAKDRQRLASLRAAK